MERTPIRTAQAPAAIGPYSQAIVVPVGDRRMIFCSGQVALDPATGAMVGGGDVAAEARQVMDNIAAVLAAAGATLDHVVKTTIFLADMADFATVNQIYGERFTDAPPARSTIQAAGLPKNARVEIEVVAIGDR
jgi:2-iminobutanoate/2-iminopropanoate deaminase